MRTDDDSLSYQSSPQVSSSAKPDENMQGFMLWMEYQKFRKENPNFTNVLESLPKKDSTDISTNHALDQRSVTNQRKESSSILPRDISFNPKNDEKKYSTKQKFVSINNRELLNDSYSTFNDQYKTNDRYQNDYSRSQSLYVGQKKIETDHSLHRINRNELYRNDYSDSQSYDQGKFINRDPSPKLSN